MDHQNKEVTREIVNFWKRINPIQEDKALEEINIYQLVANIFNPGKHFYILTNFFDLRFEYVAPAIEELLGQKPEEFTLENLFGIIHPDDLPHWKLKEEAAGVFFYTWVPDKIKSYKASYTLRLRHTAGHHKVFLFQNIALQITDGKIHHVLSVITDVSFLNILPDDRISFISINDEPSYYSLSTDPATVLQSAEALKLSERERQVILLLSKGYSSKQVGDQLGISVHTVDTHRRNLLRKTGCKNTLELAIICVNKGLI